MTFVADDLVDAAMFSMFPGFLYGRKPATINAAPHTHTLTVAELPSCTHTFVSGITGTLAPRPPAQAEVDAVKAGLLSMIAQIEADRKARPVHAAIDATHRAFRSDGRPHHYQDPLLDD